VEKVEGERKVYREKGSTRRKPTTPTSSLLLGATHTSRPGGSRVSPHLFRTYCKIEASDLSSLRLWKTELWLFVVSSWSCRVMVKGLDA
jgi:hypothetical protein